MNRFWIGVAVLLLFLGLGLGSMFLLGRFREPLTDTLEAAAEDVLSGATEAGVEKVRLAWELWNRYRHGLAAVSSHEPMEEMDGLFARLPVYARAENWGEYAACCVRLSRLAEAIAEAQSCSWWSLL